MLTASYVLWPEIFESCVERIGVCLEGPGEGAVHREEGGGDVLVLTRVDAADWGNRLVDALCNTDTEGGRNSGQ